MPVTEAFGTQFKDTLIRRRDSFFEGFSTASKQLRKKYSLQRPEESKMERLQREAREARIAVKVAPISGFIEGFGQESKAVAKAIVRAPVRGALSVMLTISKDQKKLTPTSPAEKIILGEEPVRDIKGSGMDFLKSLGTSDKNATKFAVPVGMALTGLDLYPGAGGKGTAAKQALAQATRTVRRAGEKGITFTASEIRMMKRSFKESELASQSIKQITEPRVKEEVTQAIATQVAKRIKANPQDPIVLDQSRRIFERIADPLMRGEIKPQNLPRILEKYGMSEAEFGRLWKDTVSTSGRTLGVLGNLSRDINTMLPKAGIRNVAPSLLSKTARAYRNISNIRRGLLVTQMATAARNAWSQTGRYGLQVFDDVLTGAIESITLRKAPKETMRHAFEDFYAIQRRMSKDGRDRLNKILAVFPEQEARLLNTPVGDVMLTNKVINALNIFNRTQEYFFRKMALDAKMSAEMFRMGLNPRTVKPNQIPHSIVKKSVDHALQLTFAATPKSELGKGIMNLHRVAPIIFDVTNPFPRFWLNSLKFLWDFSPGGFANLLDKRFLKKLASDNPREAMSVMSKAVLGSMMWGGAVAFRGSKFAGEKWYEIRPSPDKNPKRVIDMRAFAPFSTYLFIAEFMLNRDNLSGTDVAQGALSINRIAGSGLVLIDVLRSDSLDNTTGTLEELAGAYFGGFTVPFRTISDFMGQISEEERTVRSTREEPLIGPAVSNIPFLLRMLPEAPRYTRPEPFQREMSGLRQLTGLTIKTKTFLEQEIDRMSIKRLTPRTGDSKVDRFIIEKMGILSQELNDSMEESEVYAQMPDEAKKRYVRLVFEEIRSAAKETALSENADEIINDLIDEVIGKDPVELFKILEKKRDRGILNDTLIDTWMQKAQFSL